SQVNGSVNYEQRSQALGAESIGRDSACRGACFGGLFRRAGARQATKNDVGYRKFVENNQTGNLWRLMARPIGSEWELDCDEWTRRMPRRRRRASGVDLRARPKRRTRQGRTYRRCVTWR